MSRTILRTLTIAAACTTLPAALLAATSPAQAVEPVTVAVVDSNIEFVVRRDRRGVQLQEPFFPPSVEFHIHFITVAPPPVEVGTGCTLVGSNPLAPVVECTPSGVTGITFDMGAGDDTLDGFASHINLGVDLGPGNDIVGDGFADDTIRAGDGNDTVYLRRTGRDWVTGDAGHDTVSYARPSDLPVIASLDGIANDGWAGEGDNVDPSVERLEGGAGDDLLIGNQFDNMLVGDVGDDVLKGRGGADRLEGSAGNDVFPTPGIDGADTLVGGPDRDLVDYSGRTEPLSITLNDVATDGADGENDNVGADVENVAGGSGTDLIIGSSDANDVNAGPGNDQVVGGRGRDWLNGGGDTDIVDGGIGNDRLVDGAGNSDTLIGGPGVDHADYGYRTDNLALSLNGAADDGAPGESDNIKVDVERITGGSGTDTLSGSAAPNMLTGGAGNDAISGANGNDRLYGGEGDDAVNGGGDTDIVSGGAGNDRLVDGRGSSDTLIGGPGVDHADYGYRTDNLALSLNGAADDGAPGESDNVLANVEKLTAGSGNDTLTGSAAANTLTGGGGNDQLFGLQGDDTLVGGIGTDTGDGGPGIDTCDVETPTSCP